MKKGKKKNAKRIEPRKRNARAVSDKKATARKNSASIKNDIYIAIAKAGNKGINLKDLVSKCRLKQRGDKGSFFRELNELIASTSVVEYRKRYFLATAISAVPATVVRLNKTFGFVRKEDETDLFVAGKFLMGAMTGDKVMIIEKQTEKGPEAEVLSITEVAENTFTGVVIEEHGTKYILPDSICNFPLMLEKYNAHDYEVGQKVIAMITKRGGSHRDHRVKIVAGYGKATTASACSDAYLAASGVSVEFSNACLDEAKYVASQKITDKERKMREDYTAQKIFTIDSAESKDLDDAISLEKLGDHYVLGVHIADVSHYVRYNSELDKEAYERGTSIYFADRVVPMLPKELSNGICSLNPNEERLTFSAIITLDNEGELVGFKFKKSIIKSWVKGVYSEINSILDKNETEEVKEKYRGLYNEIFLMDELADKLIHKRKLRGAPEIDTTESKIIVENGVAVDVVPRTRGKSEMIIEEFMLMANRCAAIFSKEKQIPFVYRVHEDPPVDKINSLKEILNSIGIECRYLKDGKNPNELSQVLQKTADLKMSTAINRMVVRSMAKARYAHDFSGHYGLALDDYAHFTSPIRRYPDLTIHRIMSAILSTGDTFGVTKKYASFAAMSAQKSSQTELTAIKLERDCEDAYKAEYMQKFIGEEFDATVSSVTSFGFFAELPNTVEGLVSLGSIPQGEYTFDDGIKLIEKATGKTIMLGDKVRVKCVKADVNSGEVDFELIQTET